MAHGTTTISAPVVMPQDIAQILSIPGNDLSTVCTSQAINMWARYKPIKFPKINMLEPSEWASVRYGISRSSSLPLIGNDARLNHDVWTYSRPEGGKASPYRLTDFNRYYHVAPCPVALIFPLGDLTIGDSSQANIIGFTFTFENGISFWRSDDCCLYMRDVFYDASSLTKYLTVGLIHYLPNNYVGYFQSSSNILSTYVASQTDSSHLSPAPVANVLVDLGDFKSKVSSTYLSDDTKWQAVMFLSSNKYEGYYGALTTGSTELLQYDGNVTKDSDGYEEGCDRHVMLIKRNSWIDKITGMSLKTVYKRSGSSSTYTVDSVEISVTRESSLPAWDLVISFDAICVGGAMSNTNAQTSGRFYPTVGSMYVAFSEGETSKTVSLTSSDFTLYRYMFDHIGLGNVDRAILTCHLSRSSGEKSLSTDCDCSGGNSTYTVTNSI